MDNTIAFIWGNGEHLTILQMSVRAGLMFFLCLAIIHIGGVRAFGKKSAFDNILVIILGAILARGVVGASDYWATVSAGLCIAIIHRVLGWIAIHSPFIEKLLKGKQRLLYENGKLNKYNMDRSCVSKNDLIESLRQETQQTSLNDVEQAFMETSGRISFVLKKKDK